MAKLPPPKESAVQIAVLNGLLFHGVVCIAIPNGGSRDPREARNLKAQGVMAGAPDLVCIGDGGKVAWLEVKRPGYTASAVRESQHDAHDMLRRKGHHVAIVTSQDEAVAACRDAGLLK